MGKLIQIINEKIEKIKPEKILSDLTQNTDPTTISEFVDSKNKDERIAIAANPNLTIEQQTKLANDKVNGVKQALCYNANLDYDLARQLLDEEPARVDFIAEYGGSQLDMLAVEFGKKKNDDFRTRYTITKIFKSPSISDEFIDEIIKNFSDMLTSTDSRNLYKNQSLSKKSVYKLMDVLSKNEERTSDGSLTQLIVRHPKFIKESDIKKLNWKTISDIQSAVFFRKDISENFLLDVVKNLNENTSVVSHGGNANPHLYTSVSVLNALMEKYLTFKLSYNHEFSYFTKNTNIPLNPRLMIDMVKHLEEQGKGYNASNLLKNEYFPDYGLDEIKIDENNYKSILSSPAANIDKVDGIIKKFVTDAKSAEKAMWGLADRREKKQLIGDEAAQDLLEKMNTKAYWFQYIISGNLVDRVLDNIDDYLESVTYSMYSEQKEETPKHKILDMLSQNKKLTSSQKKKVLKMYNNLNQDEIPRFDNGVAANLTVSDKDPDPDFFEELMKDPKAKIWNIWTESSSAYFQYDDKIIPIIDKIALKTKDVPVEVIKTNGHVNFSAWFDYNNREGEKMNKKTAEKYLIHFINHGDEAMKQKLQTGFIDDDWMLPNVKVALYELTGKIDYLPDAAKDIFLF